MITHGFSGTANVNQLTLDRFDSIVIPRLTAFLVVPEPQRFVTGCAVGIDSAVARFLYGLFPPSDGHVHTFVWPGDPRTIEKVDYELRHFDADHRFMPTDSTNRDRNQFIVDLSGDLTAFPIHGEQQSRRSGTWQTIRLARAKPIPVFVYQLDQVA